MTYPACPQCQSNFTYHDGSQLVCPECAHEWQEGDHNIGCKIDGTPMNLKSEFVKKA